VALAHDWLCGRRGGEAVLERIAALLEGDCEVVGLYAMFDDGRPMSPAVDALRGAGLIRGSFLSRVPLGNTRLRRWLFPLYPRAVARLSRRLAAENQKRKIDLVVSTSSAAIKGLKAPPGTMHVCYVHAPARYVWSRGAEYRGGLRGFGLRLFGERFKTWDRKTAANVHRFMANSTHTAAEVARCWGRKSVVVWPPVDVDFFAPARDGGARGGEPRRLGGTAGTGEGFWLVVSALEPYKRIDVAVRAAKAAGVTLVVAGGGSQRRALERLARETGARVEFRGRVSDEELRGLYRSARLLVFPQVEDFGIVAAEAIACGCPVVARRAGGAVDIVEEGLSGAFFSGETTEELVQGVVAAAARAPTAADWSRARRFSGEAFDAGVRGVLGEFLGAFTGRGR
jgi:glycosyltransferase involved in cell wall biosynthesis